MTTEKEKAVLGAGTLQDFFRQFGDDIYSQVLLEILFEGLINAEDLFIFGEPEQAGDQTDHGLAGGLGSDSQTD